MAFHMPSHLESLSSLPQQQTMSTVRWRGTLTIDRFGPAGGGPQSISVTAAETEGESRFDLWPNALGVHVATIRATLADVRNWVKHAGPVLCMVLPDRLADATQNAHNLAVFGAFSQTLTQNQMVGIVPWGAPDRLPGAGMILYPMPGSTSVLAGAVFLASQFPDWAHPLQRPSVRRIPTGTRISSSSGAMTTPLHNYAFNPNAYGEGAYGSPITPHNLYGPPSAQLAPGEPSQHYEHYILGAPPSSASTTNSDGSWPADIPYSNTNRQT